MKKTIKNIMIIFFASAIFLMSFTGAFAAEINSIPANIGDNVEYELRVVPCPNNIQAMDIVIYYDSSSLEYVPYSLELHSISGFMTNTDISGEIRFNAMDFDGFVFDEDKSLANVRFTVKDTTAENLNLSYEVRAFLDNTTTDLGGTYVYDVTSVNGRTQESSKPDQQNEMQTDSAVVSSDIVSESSLVSSQDGILSESDTESSETTSHFSDNSTVDSDEFESMDIAVPFFDMVSSNTNTELPESSQVDVKERNKLYLFFSIAAAVVFAVLGLIIHTAAKRSEKDDIG